MGQRPLPYRWIAEAHPARRAHLLRYWTRVHRLTLHRYHAWQHASPAGIIDQVFGATAPAAISVATCESGLNPTAHNPSGAAGLFQLMPVHWASSGADPYDPRTNSQIAYRLSHGGIDWSAWVCQP